VRLTAANTIAQAFGQRADQSDGVNGVASEPAPPACRAVVTLHLHLQLTPARAFVGILCKGPAC